MICAHLAGIAVFATGGIGGVHRGAETTFDISADLQELARTPVTVVSAGAKAILDLPRTFEMLETLGVPVIGYCVDRLPAFWSRDGGIAAPIRLDDAASIAAMLKVRTTLGLAGGVLVCNPVPAESEIPAAEIEPVLAAALADAAAAGVRAKDVTPYLLKRVLDLTGGRSLTTNIALIRSNARVAAEIAVALADVG
jgi:pseudouridylate synthase